MIDQDGKKLFTLGEAARLAQVSEKALRYYDEHDIVKPTWRDPLTGYRYYDIETVYFIETRWYAKTLGLSSKQYDDILISEREISDHDFTSIIGRIQTMLDDKRRGVARIVREMDVLSMMQHDLITIASHELNGAAFDCHFEEQAYLMSFDDTRGSREENELAFYERVEALSRWTKSRRFGRLWRARDILSRALRENGWFCEVDADDALVVPENYDSLTSVSAIREGDYRCVLVNNVYVPETWEVLEWEIEASGLPAADLIVVAHEYGYYDSYTDFSNVIHLARLVPKACIVSL